MEYTYLILQEAKSATLVSIMRFKNPRTKLIEDWEKKTKKTHAMKLRRKNEAEELNLPMNIVNGKIDWRVLFNQEFLVSIQEYTPNSYKGWTLYETKENKIKKIRIKTTQLVNATVLINGVLKNIKPK